MHAFLPFVAYSHQQNNKNHSNNRDCKQKDYVVAHWIFRELLKKNKTFSGYIFIHIMATISYTKFLTKGGDYGEVLYQQYSSLNVLYVTIRFQFDSHINHFLEL